MRRILALALTLALLLSVGALAAEAEPKAAQPAPITPYTYAEVREHILNAASSVTINIGGVPVHYYYGDHYTAYQDEGGYYITTFSEDYSRIDINGYVLSVTVSAQPPEAVRLFGPSGQMTRTIWYYMYTDHLVQVSVGGLTVQAVISAIPGGIFVYAALEDIAGYLLGWAIDQILPNNFAFTVRKDYYYGNLDPDLGTVDYHDEYSAWWGYTRTPYLEHIYGPYYTGTVVLRFS